MMHFLNLAAWAYLDMTNVSILLCFTSNDIFLITKGYILFVNTTHACGNMIENLELLQDYTSQHTILVASNITKVRQTNNFAEKVPPVYMINGSHFVRDRRTIVKL